MRDALLVNNRYQSTAANRFFGLYKSNTYPLPHLPTEVKLEDLICINNKLILQLARPEHLKEPGVDPIIRHQEILKSLETASLQDLALHGRKELDDKGIKSKYGLVKVDNQYYAVYSGKPLGKGAFGKVVAAQNIHTGEWFALKKQSFKVDTILEAESKFQKAEAEQKVLQQLKNSTEKTLQRRRSSKGFDQYVMLMKLAEGDLLLNFMKGEPLPMVILLNIAKEWCQKVHELYVNDKLFHRDIKVENAFFDVIKQAFSLIDFGEAADASAEGVFDAKMVGTPASFAPELRKAAIQQKDNKDIKFHYTEKTEVFALGFGLARLFNFIDEDSIPISIEAQLNTPLSEYLNLELYSLDDTDLTETDVAERVEINRIISNIQKMTAEDPADRPTFQEAANLWADILGERLKQSESITIGTLDVYAYLKADEEGKAHLLRELIDRDQVILVDTKSSQHTLLDYLRVKRELEACVKQTLMLNGESNNNNEESPTGRFFVHHHVIFGTDKLAINKEIRKYVQKAPLPCVCIQAPERVVQDIPVKRK